MPKISARKGWPTAKPCSARVWAGALGAYVAWGSERNVPAGSLDGRIKAALAAAGVGRAAWPAAVEAPANCDVMAEARLPGSKAVICCSIAVIVGWARDAPTAALASDPKLDEPNDMAGIAPIVEDCTGALSAGAPANWDVMADARLLGSIAVICCWIAAIVG